MMCGTRDDSAYFDHEGLAMLNEVLRSQRPYAIHRQSMRRLHNGFVVAFLPNMDGIMGIARGRSLCPRTGSLANANNVGIPSRDAGRTLAV